MFTIKSLADIRVIYILRRTPLGRYRTSEEIAKLALFLASDDSSYIKCAQIDVDGDLIPYGGW
jgi:NAD(P)-dependent dehydrogenase (short-subunit alcohol dehydrogenase family)